MRALKRADIRAVGSGNIGATNVWRAYGWRLGAPIVLLDVAKGFVPALAGVLVAGDLEAVLAGGAAMLGHWRPVFLGFARGGKTVATAGGVFFAVAPLVGLAASAAWIVLFVLTRYASLASMLAAATLPLFAALLGEPWPTVVFAAIAAVAVLVLHRGNVRRLLEGTESRFDRGRRSRLSAKRSRGGGSGEPGGSPAS